MKKLRKNTGLAWHIGTGIRAVQRRRGKPADGTVAFLQDIRVDAGKQRLLSLRTAVWGAEPFARPPAKGKIPAEALPPQQKTAGRDTATRNFMELCCICGTACQRRPGTLPMPQRESSGTGLGLKMGKKKLFNEKGPALSRRPLKNGGAEEN